VTPQTWPCPLPAGGLAREYAIAFDRRRKHRLLIVPALFDEANKMRRLTLEVMRRLDASGIDSFLPDFPGCNESEQPLHAQATEDWLDAMSAAMAHFGATDILGIRAGCLFTPKDLPTWHYAPVKGETILRQMLRARILASREAGIEEDRQQLVDLALAQGIELAGYQLSADFFEGFQRLVPAQSEDIHPVEQSMIGGSGLWLRAEPDENREQADALAAVLSIGTTF